MALMECPHCLTRTFVDEKSEKWPCCGKLTKDDPIENIEEIKFKKEKEKLEILISHTTKVSYAEITGGILVLIYVAALIFVSSFSKMTVYWYGGVIIGFLLALKGAIDMKDAFRMKKEYKTQFCLKKEIKNEMFMKES